MDDEETLLHSDMCWKKMGHPLVPANGDDHENIVEIRRAAACHWVWNPLQYNLVRLEMSTISVQTLLEKQHPSLYPYVDQKVDALKTLCMAVWATTDEASSNTRLSPMDYDTKRAMKVLNDKIMFKRREFEFKLQQAVVDDTIGTVENQLNIDELKLLNEFQSDSNGNLKVHEHLLGSYASIQISPIAELRFILEERSLMRYLLQMASFGSDDEINEAFQVPIIRRIEAFIQLALKFTSWPFSDLRPYQTIVWACTVDQHQLLAMQIRKFNPIMLIPSPYLILPALLV